MSHQDRGYAWVVCGASFLMNALYCGIFFSSGMFYLMFNENIEGDSSTIALIVSINSAALYTVAPSAGILVSKYGERKIGICGALIATLGLILASISTRTYHLCLSYGILTGIGLGLQCLVALSVLSVNFDKWLGLANGISLSGCGVGSFLFPYLIKTFEDVYGWRGALLICGGIQLQGVVCGALYHKKTANFQKSQRCSSDRLKIRTLTVKEDPSKSDLMKENISESHLMKKDGMERKETKPRKSICLNCKRLDKSQALCFHLKNYLSIFKSPVFTLYCFSELFFMMAVSIVYTHIGWYLKSLSFSNADAALLFLVMGIINTVMRFVTGLVTQIPKCHPLILCLSSLPLGIITSLFSFFSTLPLLFMYAATFGILICPPFTLHVPVFKSIMRPEEMSLALGFMLLFYVPGTLAGAPLAGWLYDTTGVYVYSFYLASALLMIAGTLSVLCLQCYRRNTI